ncbi:hypothetical protein CONPUDRAFT_160598 [Coniophora puteana RWD-64-598 SS2]|uniref:Uncharacterized protein n=1 Tax=Coniophora puteana (strain RWD-64-598) TaxID=741705 RepID=R7SDQ7_CONPW|nr:uncharacterized protein CONPUDRAFT_160598 [Coniophora puteana RWD-64-598 SS2]EIW73892.1 hypothetical protein CONPUDRAFT_160598 [Coniophora puteana RWD-64-598 SS2]
MYYRNLVLAMYSTPATFDTLNPRIKVWSTNVSRSSPTDTSRAKSTVTSTSRKSALTTSSSATSLSSSTSAHQSKPVTKPAPTASIAEISQEPPHSLRDEDDEAGIQCEAAAMRSHNGRTFQASVGIIRTSSPSSTEPGLPFTQRPQHPRSIGTSQPATSSKKRPLPSSFDEPSENEVSGAEDLESYEPPFGDSEDDEPGSDEEAEVDHNRDDGTKRNCDEDAERDRNENAEHDCDEGAKQDAELDCNEDAGCDCDRDAERDRDESTELNRDESAELDHNEDGDQEEQDVEMVDNAAVSEEVTDTAAYEAAAGAEGDQLMDSMGADDAPASHEGVKGVDDNEQEVEIVAHFGPSRRVGRTTASTAAKASNPIAHRAKRVKPTHSSNNPPANRKKASGKPKVTDLPRECQESRAFGTRLMPTLALWMGCSSKPWNPLDEEIEEACANIYRVVFDREFSDLSLSEQSAVLSIACERLCIWRNNFSSTAVAALLVLLGSRGLSSDAERVAFAKRLLVQTAFMYEKIENGKPTNLFEGSYFVIVLSSHYAFIKGHVDVPEFQDLIEPDYLPFAAYSLAAAACVRAIQATVDGKMANVEKTITLIVNAGCTPESGWGGVKRAKGVISQANRKPRSARKGRGKKTTAAASDVSAESDSVTSSAPSFSEANSGAVTAGFYASVMRCAESEDAWRLKNSWEAAAAQVNTSEEDEEESDDDSTDKVNLGPNATRQGRRGW